MVNFRGILNKINNDKVLGIIVILSVILIGTLIYYNLNSKSIQERFEGEDDNCKYYKKSNTEGGNMSWYRTGTDQLDYQYKVYKNKKRNKFILKKMRKFYEFVTDRLSFSPSFGTSTLSVTFSISDILLKAKC